MTSADDAVTQLQHQVTHIALDAAADAGFALAGSGGLREHGLVQRLSEDVDLFTTAANQHQFTAAVDQVLDALRRNGLDATVDPRRRSDQYARLRVLDVDGNQVDVDMGIDWRRDAPVHFTVGPVLSLDDAVGNKVAALFSRAEPRDYLDVDAIRASGRFTDQQLLSTAAERDPGFDVTMFADQLDRARFISYRDVAGYGITPEELAGVQQRAAQWATALRTTTPSAHQDRHGSPDAQSDAPGGP